MAQEDFIFTDKAQYKPSMQEVGYSPVQAGDVTPLMEKNKETLSDNFKRHQAVEEANIERENEAAKLADDANVQRLSEFSEKLTGVIKTGIDRRIKKVTAELEVWALKNKDELLKSYAEKAKLEEQALNGQVIANGLAANAADTGAPSDVIKKLEDLGGWKKVVVNRVLLQKAGIGYAEFRGSAEAKAIRLPRLDENKKPTGETYNIVDAVGPAEQAAAIKAIQTAYVGKFQTLGTLADRHELIWSKIEEHEDSITTANGLEAQQQLQEERKKEINNQILMAANHSPLQFGKKLQELVTLHTDTYRSPTAAASNFIIAFNKAVKDGLIPTDQAKKLLDETKILDKSTGEMVFLKDHAMFGPLIEENDIEATVQEKRGKEHDKKTIKIQNDAKDLEKDMLENPDAEVSIPKLIKANGGYLKESDILTLKAAWLNDPRGGGAGQPFPPALDNFATVQDQDDTAARALAERFKENNNGFITTLEASRLPEHIRKEYETAGVIKDNLTPSNSNYADAEIAINGITTDFYKEFRPGEGTTTHLQYQTQAKRAYEKQYAKLRGLNLSEDQAHEGAKQHIRDNYKSYAIPPIRGATTKALTKLNDVGNALKQNVNAAGHVDFTVKIPGLEHEISQLDTIALAGGGKLPQIFFNATRDYKMPGGQNAAWALARAQYKAYTGKDLIMPDGVTMNTSKGKLNTPQNQNLNHKNTDSKTNRVIIETSTNEGVVEGSEQSGDVSTMTQNDMLSIIESPYKDQLNAAFYQNTEPVDGVSWKLSDVIFSKNHNPNYRNAGQYGLSSKQIEDGAKALGLDLKTTEFNLETERKIFLNRLNARLKNNNNKYAGLIQRFSDLNILTKEQVTRWDELVDSEDNSVVAKGPFNKSEVLLNGIIPLKGV